MKMINLLEERWIFLILLIVSCTLAVIGIMHRSFWVYMLFAAISLFAAYKTYEAMKEGR